MVALRFGIRVYIRKPRRGVRVPPVSWKYGRHSNRIGKPHCFNGFPVALSMLRPAFWSPTEPAWDFKITPLFVPKAIFGGGGWLATGASSVITSEPANQADCRDRRPFRRHSPSARPSDQSGADASHKAVWGQLRGHRGGGI